MSGADAWAGLLRMTSTTETAGLVGGPRLTVASGEDRGRKMPAGTPAVPGSLGRSAGFSFDSLNRRLGRLLGAIILL